MASGQLQGISRWPSFAGCMGSARTESTLVLGARFSDVSSRWGDYAVEKRLAELGGEALAPRVVAAARQIAARVAGAVS